MSEAPAWLVSLVENVAACMEIQGPASLGYRWLNEEDEFWEVIVYPNPVELVGGAVDGQIVSPLFSLDLWGLSSRFDKIEDFSWQAHALGPHDPQAPYVSIEGMYRGYYVYLQVLSEAPEDEEPGLELEVGGGVN